MRQNSPKHDHNEASPERRALGNEVAARADPDQQDSDGDDLKPSHALGVLGTI